MSLIQQASSDTPFVSRGVERLFEGRPTSDGAGVKLTRVLTRDLQRRLDPFLMLDAFRNEHPEDYMGGFPDHPHRGFETITYMLAGRMRHHDSAGNSGLLAPGGAQWMTAGSGLIHSELPEQQDGLMEGFQLWLNLPARNKMIPPSYRDIPAAAIPELIESGVRVRIIAGAAGGVEGAVMRPDTAPLFLDIHLAEGAAFTQAIPRGHNAFLYVYRGAVQVGEREIRERVMAVLANDGEGVRLTADAPARLILVAGKPLSEPIVQYGPFVMNSQSEIEQALQDYQAGRFSQAHVARQP